MSKGTQPIGMRLIESCSNCDIENVKRLIFEAKANLNYVSEDGSTPLHYASRYARTEVVQKRELNKLL